MADKISKMVSVAQAKSLIATHTLPLPAKRMFIKDAAFLVLAEDIIASKDIPGFRQSAMDGYAIRYADYESGGALFVSNSIAAGDDKLIQIIDNQAVRIFTGAAIPASADTVVVQEKVELLDNQLIITDSLLLKGNNVREQGSEVKAGSVTLKLGDYLHPAAIGFLASIGIAEVMVIPRPCIHLIITGNELKKPDEELLHGQVYEANSYSLVAALQKFYFKEVKIHYVADDLMALQNVLQSVLIDADLILLTGGVSVGDYDFVVEAAKHCGITELFHGIKQKPGKPLYFGMKDRIPVFGLPGNPSSVLTCFYEYVLLALSSLCLQKQLLPSVQYKKISEPVKKKSGFTTFLKGNYSNDMVEPLVAQESYRLSSFARSNCLIYLPDTIENVCKDEIVEIHIIN